MAPPEDITDTNGHGDGGLAVAPSPGDITGDNNDAHHDGARKPMLIASCVRLLFMLFRGTWSE
jgi:hypothetical protein